MYTFFYMIVISGNSVTFLLINGSGNRSAVFQYYYYLFRSFAQIFLPIGLWRIILTFFIPDSDPGGSVYLEKANLADYISPTRCFSLVYVFGHFFAP